MRAVGVARLVERLLPKPEIHGSSPIIIKFYFTINNNKTRKDENKGKEAWKGTIL